MRKPITILILITTVIATGAFAISTRAAFNKEINYQAKLTDTSNVAVTDGSYHMFFRLYDALTGGNIVWFEDRSEEVGDRIQVTSGLFSVLLGSSTALTNVDFDQTLYLEVEIDGIASTTGEVLSPRKKLGAVPAAFEADKLDGIDSASFLRSDAADTMSASAAGTLLTITQSGAGDILNLIDGSTEVFTVLDGGNVGIGTTSPYSKLSVHANNGETNTTLFNIASSTVSATTSLFTVTNTGNVGIGTANPLANLDIRGGSQSLKLYGMYNSDTDYMRLAFNMGVSSIMVKSEVAGTGNINGGWTFYSTGGLLFNYGSNPGKGISMDNAGFYPVNNNVIDLGISGQAWKDLYLVNNAYITGSVGIGTTSPYAALSVVGETVSSYFTATSTTATSTIDGNFWVKGQMQLGTGSSYLRDTATSTMTYGINLANGCFAINGTCVGGGSGTVNSGTLGDVAYYASAGTAVSGTTTANLRNTLLHDWAGSTVLTTLGTITTGTWNATDIANTAGGTGQDSSSWNGPISVANGVWEATTTLGVFYGGTGLTSATAGNVLIGNTATALQATSSLFVASSGNVGIGTTTPWAKLSVTNTGSGPSFIVEDSASPDSSPFVIEESGWMGLGINDPISMAHFKGSSNDTAWANHPTAVTVSLQNSDSTDNNWFNIVYRASDDTAAAGITTQFYDQASHYASINFETRGASGYKRAMTIYDGNVGIGTTSPYAALSVVGETVSSYFTATSTTATSSLAWGLSIGTSNQSGVLQVLGNATSSFANGIDLSGGCFAVNGTCVGGGGGGSGTVGTGAIGQIPYYAAAGTTLTATSTLFIHTNSYVGMGTTAPQAKLHIGNASTTKLSTLDESLFVEGDLEVGASAYLGPMEFAQDAGMISWIDMPVSSSAADNTIESYTARIDSTNILTVYAQADGSGGVDNARVGVGTTTPGTTFAVSGNALADAWLTYEIVEMNLGIGPTASTTLFEDGEILMLDQNGDLVKGLSSTSSPQANMPILGAVKSVNVFGRQSVKPAILGTYMVKVNNENGDILIGDRLTYSSEPGAAAKATVGGEVLGYALETLNASSGTIKAFISPQWFSGTTTPSSIVLAGEIYAKGFINTSSQETKKDITFLAAEDYGNMLEKIASTSIATYLYNSDTNDSFVDSSEIRNWRRLGLIAEQSPVEILSADQKGIDLYKMTSFLWGGMKAQQNKMEDLSSRLDTLEEIIAQIQEKEAGIEIYPNNQLNPGPTTQSIGWVLNQFNQIGVKIANGVIEAGEFIADKITARKVVTEFFEMKDRDTGDTWCVSIRNGEWDKFRGTCGENSLPAESGNNQELIANDTIATPDEVATSTPNVETEPPTETEEEPIVKEVIFGCTDRGAENYNSEATEDDASCTYIIEGCIDPQAENYNIEATQDDASCVYLIEETIATQEATSTPEEIASTTPQE